MNSCGQVTLRGKIRLQAATVVERFDERLVLPAGTEVDYIGLQHAVHIVQFRTAKGVFAAVRYADVPAHT